MNLRREVHQKSKQLELPYRGRAEGPRATRSGESRLAAHVAAHSGSVDEQLLELIVAGSNVEVALRRVKKSRGSRVVPVSTG